MISLQIYWVTDTITVLLTPHQIPTRHVNREMFTNAESSLKAGEVQLKRSGSSQPLSSSQCRTAAPGSWEEGQSEKCGDELHGCPGNKTVRTTAAPLQGRVTKQITGKSTNTEDQHQ